MEWAQIFVILLTNASLIVWFRAESRADWRHSDLKLEEYRKDSRESEKKILGLIESIQQEMKDFHARLAAQDLDFKAKIYALEERTRNR
jgi:hypothetical protein